jgi:hypothetical protein
MLSHGPASNALPGRDAATFPPIVPATLGLCGEVAWAICPQAESRVLALFLLGAACGAIRHALPGVEPTRELLEEVARCCTQAYPLQTAAAKVDEWIAIHDPRRARASGQQL